MSKEQVVKFCTKKFLSEGIPTIGWTKFFQHVLEDKFKSENAPGLIQKYIMNNYYEPSIDLIKLKREILEKISEDDQMLPDFVHLFDNLSIYLDEKSSNSTGELKSFCKQIYNKFDLAIPENIDLINEIKGNIDVLTSNDKTDYEIKIGNLKDILLKIKVISTDSIIVQGLKLMDPFFADPIKFDTDSINNFTYQDKNLGEFLGYEEDTNTDSLTLIFSKCNFTLCSREDFDKTIIPLHINGQITNATYKKINEQILPLMKWNDFADNSSLKQSQIILEQLSNKHKFDENSSVSSIFDLYGNFKTYMVINEREITLYFEKTTLTIRDKAEFYEIAYKLYAESRTAFSDIDHMIYCMEHRKELANQRRNSEWDQNKPDQQKQNSPKSPSKLARSITYNDLNKIDNNFFYESENREILEKINQLEKPIKAIIIDFF